MHCSPVGSVREPDLLSKLFHPYPDRVLLMPIRIKRLVRAVCAGTAINSQAKIMVGVATGAVCHACAGIAVPALGVEGALLCHSAEAGYNMDDGALRFQEPGKIPNLVPQLRVNAGKTLF